MDAETKVPLESEHQVRHEAAPEVASHLGFIASMRLHRAERIKAKMEHKDALYEELGMAALEGKRQAPEEHRPQTVAEQFTDWRLQRKSDKKLKADIYAYRTAKTHGHDMAPAVPSVRHGITESALGVATDRQPTHSIWDVAWGNIKRVFEGPHIPGYTSLKRKIEKARVVKRVALNEYTSAETRQRLTEINAEQVKLGNKMHKTTRRTQRKHNERLALAAEQPILGRWREMRHRRAQATIGRLVKHAPDTAKHEDSDSYALPPDPRFTDELVKALRGPVNLASSGDSVKITNYIGTEKQGDTVKHYIEYEDEQGNTAFTTLDNVLWSHLPAARQKELKKVGLDPYALDALNDPLLKPAKD